jgi:hypothetical protein
VIFDISEVKAEKMDKVKKMPYYIPVILALLSVIFRIIPDWLDLFDVMIGKEGLKNIIASLIFAFLSQMMITVPIIILGAAAAVLSVRFFKNRENGVGKFAALFIVLAVILIPSGIVGMFNFTDDFDNAKLALYSADGKRHNDIQLLGYCISDFFTDEYDMYIVNAVYSDNGLPSKSSRREYKLSGYYDTPGLTVGNNRIFYSQVGREDYSRLQKSLPIGFDITVTVYKRSRFIRSIEPSVDFGREESIGHFFEISVNGDKIVRSENMSAYEIDNLMWCEFHKGDSTQIKNALCGINADNSFEYSHTLKGDEICLFAWVDGEYKRVSNIIYKEDISQ